MAKRSQFSEHVTRKATRLPRAIQRCAGVSKQRPVELPFLRLQERPRHTQIDGREPGKILQRVGGLQLRAVVLGDIGVEVHRPAHVRVDERLTGVRRLDRNEAGLSTVG